MDFHTALEGRRGGKYLGIVDGKRCVTLHQPGRYAAHGFNGEAQGRYIQQQHTAAGFLRRNRL